MEARDVMATPVITVKPYSSVNEVAETLLEKRISALPVVDDDGKLVGIISEGDLLHRVESATARRRSWWLQLMTSDTTLASEYVKAHSHKVGDIMTPSVITASPETPLSEIAILMEQHAINRVPILHENGRLVGIVTRSNLVQAVATASKPLQIDVSDRTIREKLLAHLNAQPWAHTELLTVSVGDGVVNLWGLVGSDTERQAIRVAAEETPGVRAVNDYMSKRPFGDEG